MGTAGLCGSQSVEGVVVRLRYQSSKDATLVRIWHCERDEYSCSGSIFCVVDLQQRRQLYKSLLRSVGNGRIDNEGAGKAIMAEAIDNTQYAGEDEREQ